MSSAYEANQHLIRVTIVVAKRPVCSEQLFRFCKAQRKDLMLQLCRHLFFLAVESGPGGTVCLQPNYTVYCDFA